MVQGKITLLDEMKDPYGLWLEIEDGEAVAGLWIPSPIARRMPANVGGGDIVSAVGRVCREEPPLSGRLDIMAADQIEVAAE
jgi:hypothetical protein